MLASPPTAQPAAPALSVLAQQLEALDLGLVIQEAQVPGGALYIESEDGTASAIIWADGRANLGWERHHTVGTNMQAMASILAAVRHCVVHG